MKIAKFFKILNKKIEKYDNMTSNPFGKVNVPITLVWVEDKGENIKDAPNLNQSH